MAFRSGLETGPRPGFDPSRDLTESRPMRPHARRGPGLHPEMFAEVDAAHALVLDDFGRRAGREHAAVADDVGVIADAQCFAHIVVRDENPDIAAFEEA